MSGRNNSRFLTIRTEGGLLPADFLQKIAQGHKDVQGLESEAYGLEKSERLNEAVSRSWSRLVGSWKKFKSIRASFRSDEPGTGPTREKWLLILFDELGFGKVSPTKALEIEGKLYPFSHLWKQNPIHMVGVQVDLDKRTPRVAGAAGSSPHSLIQSFLNSSEGHIWGIVTNGLKLRILRDNKSLTRQAYIEIDLESMFDGEIYSDFYLFWLVAHATRFAGEKSESCWLERWVRDADEQGTRALDRLREGVERAISTLGSGFIQYSANGNLRKKLREGILTKDDFYRQVLRIVYRIIFLLVAEDRGLLLMPKGSRAAKELYHRYYSVDRLRDMAGFSRGSKHSDLYESLKLVMEKLGKDEGCVELALPALGGSLWSTGSISDLLECRLTNSKLLEAVRFLSYRIDGKVRRNIDYRNLGSEELGSVYESLLELQPKLNIDAGLFELTTAAGNERKTTGSYYTPDSLVQCLLDTALEPIISDAVISKAGEVAAEAILKLKVCDPAVGSGHFLIAAAHRMAKRIASARTGEEEPSPEATRTALRDVIGRCLYGVDINPMSAELCRVSLWLEALEPGKPLLFLDHHIRVGNSLLGTTPELVAKGIPDEAYEPIAGDTKESVRWMRKLNKDTRQGQSLFNFEKAKPWDRLGNLPAALIQLEQLEDDSLKAIHDKEERYRKYVEGAGYENARLLHDTWCAAFIWPKNTCEYGGELTTEHLRKIEQNPHSVSSELRKKIREMANRYKFFHWHLEFPAVFGSDQKGGFDVVLTNPPWDVFQPEENKFFSSADSSVLEGNTASDRKQRIKNLQKEQPIIWQRWINYCEIILRSRFLMGSSGRFSLTSYGKTNLYSSFSEASLMLISQKGRVGIIVPTGIATDEPNKYFMQSLFKENRLISLFDFENKRIFPAVHSSFKFCLLTMGGPQAAAREAVFAFFLHSTEQLKEPGRSFKLTGEDIALLNANTKTCPIFRNSQDAELTKTMYRRVPSFQAEGKPDGDLWSMQLARLFMMDSDSGEFISMGTQSDVCQIRRLYESKLIHQFDHRFASFEDVSVNDLGDGQAIELMEKNPNKLVVSRFSVAAESVEKRFLRSGWKEPWALGLRDITNVTNERTIIATIIPREAAANNLPLILSDKGPQAISCLCAALNSFVLDYISRQKVGGTHINLYILQQIPVLPLQIYSGKCPWSKSLTIQEWLLPRILELIYTAWDLEPFARDCGWSCAPFRWDDGRRFLLRCELDAAFFILYLGLENDWSREPESLIKSFQTPRHAVDYIMDTFPIVKRKDDEKHGSYRTKETILEIYDEMLAAINVGKPYKTKLNPPPADPSVAHPPKVSKKETAKR